MSKKEWGIKRICPSCGIKYYDFNKSPIVCPECNFEFDPDLLLKSRKGRTISNKVEEVAPESNTSSKTKDEEIVELDGQESVIEEIQQEDDGLSSEILDDHHEGQLVDEESEVNEEIPFIEEELSSVESELSDNDDITIEIDEEDAKS